MSQRNNIFTVHKYDARKINELISEPIVDVTITSPPYYDMKDYGYKEQIGFGQSYETYLEDLKTVFQNVLNCTKDTGSLWVIIDTFRRNNEIVPLPFDFAAKLSSIGWKFQEIIIWGKDKTVPWSGKGHMRRLFEYILVFSKTDEYNFFKDEVRQYDSLKKWWVKYPERYNPKGKTPEAIWNFPIPVQGAWGKSYVRHFCPLPEDLIAQILKLTTHENDVVLDPFSGSGAVLAKADNMKRRYIGTELNSEYIEMFKNYMSETGVKKRLQYEQEVKLTKGQNAFEKTIIELRALKYIRVIYKGLNQEAKEGITRIYVSKPIKAKNNINKIASVNYTIECDIAFVQKIEEQINEISTRPTSSTFGIEASYEFVPNIMTKISPNVRYYTYSKTVTHKYQKSIKGSGIASLGCNDIIISNIKLDFNEKDFE